MLKVQRGISLVESLLVLLLGSTLLTIVIGLYVTTVSAGIKSVEYSRLRANLQAINTLIVNDVRRSGYGGDGYLVGSNKNKLVDLINTEKQHCIINAYNYNDSVTVNENYMGFRLNQTKHEIQFGTNTDSSAINCYKDGLWIGVSKTEFMKVTELDFTEIQSSNLNEDGTMRKIQVRINAELTSNSQIKYSLNTIIQVRNIERH